MVKRDKINRNIENLTKKAVHSLLTTNPNLKISDSIQKNISISQELRNPSSAAGILCAAIKDDESFGFLRHGWIQLRDGAGIAINADMLVHRLIYNAINGHSIKQFIAESRLFARQKSGITETFFPLAGIKLREPIKINESMDIISWEDIPDCEHKAVFGRTTAQKNLSQISFFPMSAVAECAIRKRSSKCQVLFSSNTDARKSGFLSDNYVLQFELIQDVVRCITALVPYPVSMTGSWSQLDSKIGNELSPLGYTYGPRLFDARLRDASYRPIDISGDNVKNLIMSFCKFNVKDKPVIRISLDRLNQALRRLDIEDVAIDLGIALEIMLLHGIEENSRGEMRYRSSIRGSAFLGGTKRERLSTFNLLKEAYNLRSKAVHAGTIRGEKNGVRTRKILNDAAAVCSRIARSVIERGSFPNWDIDYVIGDDG